MPSRPGHMNISILKNISFIRHPRMALDALDDDGLLGLIAGAERVNITSLPSQ